MSQADLTAVNLECAITAQDTWYEGPEKAFYFRARPAAADVLADAGVDVVSLANNHALDAGVPGLLDTVAILDAHGIAHAGAGATPEDAARPAIVTRAGRRWGFLAYCDHQADFAAAPGHPGIRFLDVERADAAAIVAEDVRRLRPQVDAVAVAFHWQANWAPVVTPLYRQLGHACLAAGAALVWGHSPHHFQGVEWVGRGVILYSTGDLIDDYAVDEAYRNDQQLLFEVDWEPGGMTRVAAWPISIVTGLAVPAQGADRDWIAKTFSAYCQAVGSTVRPEGDRLRVER
jgi:poly-gamma-glutamate synthesis protein (capsule biosynthesis protein)